MQMSSIDNIIRLSINRLGDALNNQLVIIRDIENIMHQAVVDPAKMVDLKKLLDNLRYVRRRLRSEMNIIYSNYHSIDSKELALDIETLARYYIEVAWKTETRILKEVSKLLDTQHDLNEVIANKKLAERIVDRLNSKD